MSLEALERSDLSRLPGGIFTRAFVRAYAEEVGLDPDLTIHDFIAELPPETAAATRHPAAVEDGEKLESDRKAVTTALRLFLVSVPIAGFVVYYGTHRTPVAPPESAPTVMEHSVSSEPPPDADALPDPIEDDDAAAEPAGGPADAAPAASAAEHLTGELTMVIAPTGTCWVSVTVDGEQAFSGLMKAGERRQIAAHDEISLNVGDAGAFVYTLNGKPGRPLGAPGEVVSRRITSADVKNYVTP